MIPRHSLDAGIYYQFGRWLCRWLPRWYCRLFARGMADLSTMVDRGLLALKEEHYRVLFPGMRPAARRRMARQCFRNFAGAIVDLFLASDLHPERIDEVVSHRTGSEGFLEAVGRRRGVIVLSAHLACWELGGTALRQHGFPLWVVAKAEEDGEVENYRIGYRGKVGARTVVVGRDPLSLLPAARLLREGKLLAMMGDIWLWGPSAVVDVHGHPARLPTGWATLAAVTGASVVPSFLLPDGRGRYRVAMDAPFTVEADGQAGRGEALRRAAGRFARCLEGHILAHPEHWFAFRPFFLEVEERLGMAPKPGQRREVREGSWPRP